MKKILNLYAGIGGNRKLWKDCQVTAVEFDENIAAVYKKYFPEDTVIVGDAHQYLIDHYNDGWDFIWVSPPCPTHSKLANSSQKGNGIIRYPDMKLYQEIIFLKHFCQAKWVVENVRSYYTPLIEPTIFNRHYFWSNFTIHHKDIKDVTRGLMSSFTNEPKIYQELLGFCLDGCVLPGQNKKRTVLRNCVLPELGKHIFDCAVGTMIKEDQLELFA